MVAVLSAQRATAVKYTDIFVPGGFPRHTYNPRSALNLEVQLAALTQNLCKLVTITGQTKSGKTVLARRVLSRDETIWIEGGSASTEDEFWQTLVNELDAFQTVEEATSSEVTGELSAKGTAEANFLVAKGSGEVGASTRRSHGKVKLGGRTVSSKVAALAGLRKARYPLVIDDFHYLPRDVQGKIIRALKPLIFDGQPVAVIAIPHRRYDAVKVEREMAGRIVSIQVPPWSKNELCYIPETGFRALGYEVDHRDAERMAAEAIGSPHLIQDFCRSICMAVDAQYSPKLRGILFPPNAMESVFRSVAETIGRPIFEKLARGPRQRSDRKTRHLTDGRKVDIYELVLHALASLKPDLVSLEYEDLRGAIREVSASQIPQLQEVARVLRHMASIATSDQSSTPVIDFEEVEKKLHVTDPYFAFYLRWGNLSR